jgi:hypothetical protein
MKIRGAWLAGGTLLIAVLLSFLLGAHTFPEKRPASGGIGDARALRASYERWKAHHIRNEGHRKLILPLGYSKGLSARFTKAHGHLTLDLTDGSLSVEVQGLSPTETFDVWLIDNRPGPGRSVRPEPGDAMLRVGTLKPQGTAATLETRLARERLTGFAIDLVVVTRAGESPEDGGLLFGSPTLFQRIYYSEQAGRLAAFAGRGRGGTRDSEAGANLLVAPFSVLVPGPAEAQQVDLADLFDALVAQGEELFFKETFNGNGRTCGTCHPARNNLTIDPAFIASLPANDPLFVAEFMPDLAENFENPILMRQFGLILENVDGFDDLENKFVMRGVPHTLALSTSLKSPGGPSERTGWGGDGAPGSGSLRDFATGAVTQHFTKTLKRRPGKDFRLPTDGELDALAAFQLSLGRRDELVLTGAHALALKPPGGAVDRGRRIFVNPPAFGGPLDLTIAQGKCNLCHTNAGANIASGVNSNFDTGVENMVPHPADVTGEPRPRDGGFGRGQNSNGSFGDGTFNTPPLVEAADTGPFFHNNVVDTIEDAVRFYTTSAFSTSPSARFIGAITLSVQDIADVGAFLRTINALENIRSSLDRADRAKRATNFGQAKKLLVLAIADAGDAIKVLQGAGLYSSAVTDLEGAEGAKEKLIEASETKNKAERDVLIDQAMAKEVSARAAIVQ